MAGGLHVVRLQCIVGAPGHMMPVVAAMVAVLGSGLHLVAWEVAAYQLQMRQALGLHAPVAALGLPVVAAWEVVAYQLQVHQVAVVRRLHQVHMAVVAALVAALLAALCGPQRLSDGNVG